MIGERINQARKAAGLSLRALAEKAGISAMAISKYETGKSTPSSGVLLSLSKALEVPVEYFFRTAKIKLHEPEYRKHRKLPRKLQTRIEGDVLEQVERFFELMDLLPSGPISRFRIPITMLRAPPRRFGAHGISVPIRSRTSPIRSKSAASLFSRLRHCTKTLSTGSQRR